MAPSSIAVALPYLFAFLSQVNAFVVPFAPAATQLRSNSAFAQGQYGQDRNTAYASRGVGVGGMVMSAAGPNVLW